MWRGCKYARDLGNKYYFTGRYNAIPKLFDNREVFYFSNKLEWFSFYRKFGVFTLLIFQHSLRSFHSAFLSVT